METTQENIAINKPMSVRAIFIMNALKIFLALGFYMVFTFTEFRVGDIGPEIILYTLMGYVVLFGAMVVSILKRNILGLRISILLDFLVSFPSKAIIGFVIAIASMILTFRKTAQRYFQ